ncbi:hypothetical protein PD5205_03161 [Xanthomonas fragariae]|uniref:Uncharacterized protein n=1 Tax=Xanthomonas fragariae TaxID=48664 RepID=A0A1Y6HLN9_9XANT|nr:hypothetical protein PD885_00834 [Xanthomonas fragariae]SMR04439.1 hypothetical protein PD5205_03161 [Xanthomonas fragariae]
MKYRLPGRAGGASPDPAVDMPYVTAGKWRMHARQLRSGHDRGPWSTRDTQVSGDFAANRNIGAME